MAGFSVKNWKLHIKIIYSTKAKYKLIFPNSRNSTKMADSAMTAVKLTEAKVSMH